MGTGINQFISVPPPSGGGTTLSGNISTPGTYTLRTDNTFKISTDTSVPDRNGFFSLSSYNLIGGGGAGGGGSNFYGGGGGGSGYRTSVTSLSKIYHGILTIIVGAGGAGIGYISDPSNGTSSSISSTEFNYSVSGGSGGVGGIGTSPSGGAGQNGGAPGIIGAGGNGGTGISPQFGGTGGTPTGGASNNGVGGQYGGGGGGTGVSADYYDPKYVSGAGGDGYVSYVIKIYDK